MACLTHTSPPECLDLPSCWWYGRTLSWLLSGYLKGEGWADFATFPQTHFCASKVCFTPLSCMSHNLTWYRNFPSWFRCSHNELCNKLGSADHIAGGFDHFVHLQPTKAESSTFVLSDSRIVFDGIKGFAWMSYNFSHISYLCFENDQGYHRAITWRFAKVVYHWSHQAFMFKNARCTC